MQLLRGQLAVASCASFGGARPDPAIFGQLVGKLPWGQSIKLVARGPGPQGAGLPRKLERRLVTRGKYLMLDLGKGVSFIASQRHGEVGGEQFYVDLLCYRRKLLA